MGHRQELTRVMVKSITLGKSSPKPISKKETVNKKPNQNLKNLKLNFSNGT